MPYGERAILYAVVEFRKDRPGNQSETESDPLSLEHPFWQLYGDLKTQHPERGVRGVDLSHWYIWLILVAGARFELTTFRL